MQKEPFIKPRLFCPGPTPYAPAIDGTAPSSTVYHRGDSFRQLFQQCRRGLQTIFGSQNEPLILSASGTGAMEAALTNLTSPKDRVLVIAAGKFGQRWSKMATAHECQVNEVKVPWGDAISTVELEAAVAAGPVQALFIQASETSTCIWHPVEALAAIVRKHHPECLIVVDAVTALCAHRFKMQDWDLDCVIGGSQKGFGIPPGLSFLALSDRALKKLSNRPRFYFDLERELKQQAQGQTAFTPAVSLVQNLAAVLASLEETGLDQVAAHHYRISTACKRAVAAMGLSLFGNGPYSNVATAIEIPESVSAPKLIKHLEQKFALTIAGGQDQLKGKIIRFSHLGFVDVLDFMGALSALELSLHELGFKGSIGKGATAALNSLAESQ